MEGEEARRGADWEKIAMKALLAIAVALCIFLLLTVYNGNGSINTRQLTHSDLIRTEEIAKLSVSKFIYNGIAQPLKVNGEPDYNALYKSTVKVSVDANGISYSVNEKEKVITFVFPEFQMDSPVIDVDSVRLIPNRRDLLMRDVIAVCRSDALEEARKSDKLISSARENLKTIMEAWYAPVLKGYTFEYQFGDSEGGDAK